MTKKLKLATTLGAMVAIAAPLATMACGSSETDKAPEVFLVTDAGDTNDKSFNEQALHALSSVSGISNASAGRKVIKPDTHSAANISAGYASAQTAGAKYIFAPGYYHQDAIAKYNADTTGDKVNFILVDSGNKAANVAAITYETKYAGFQAGYLASKFLEAKNDTTPTLGTWGGANIPSVTDFMIGFVYGAKTYNDTRAQGKNAVSFATFTNDADFTNSDFNSGGGNTKATTLLGAGTDIAGNADVLFPVAGPQTNDALGKIKELGTNTRHKVIGVDVDQAEVYGNDKKYFITSVEKNIKDALTNVYKKIKGDTSVDSSFKGLNEITIGNLANGLTSISDNTESGKGWDGIANASSIYSAAKAYTTATIDTAVGTSTTLESKTWADALTLLRTMNNNDAKA